MKKAFIIIGLFTCFSLSASIEFTPEDIARQAKKVQSIIAKAKKDWPENYGMQKRAIEYEIQAMKDMEELSKKMNVPD